MPFLWWLTRSILLVSQLVLLGCGLELIEPEADLHDNRGEVQSVVEVSETSETTEVETTENKQDADFTFAVSKPEARISGDGSEADPLFVSIAPDHKVTVAIELSEDQEIAEFSCKQEAELVHVAITEEGITLQPSAEASARTDALECRLLTEDDQETTLYFKLKVNHPPQFTLSLLPHLIPTGVDIRDLHIRPSLTDANGDSLTVTAKADSSCPEQQDFDKIQLDDLGRLSGGSTSVAGVCELTLTVVDGFGGSSTTSLTVESFVPPSSDDIELWLSSTNIEAEDGALVGTIKEIAGGDTELVQTSAASQPTYLASGPRGFPALQFDGSDDFMQTSDAGLVAMSGTTASSVLFVGRTYSDHVLPTEHSYLSFNRSDGSAAGSLIGLASDHASANRLRMQFGTESITLRGTDIYGADFNFVEFRASNSVQSSDPRTGIASMKCCANASQTGGDDGPFMLGAMNPSVPSGFAKMQFAELIVLNSSLPWYDRDVYTRYLIAKYKFSYQCYNPNSNWVSSDGGCKFARESTELVFSLYAYGNYSRASDFCDTKWDGGYNDWRLPTEAEIAALAGFNDGQEAYSFSGTSEVWTSTEAGAGQHRSRQIGGGGGADEADTASNSIVCVRDPASTP